MNDNDYNLERYENMICKPFMLTGYCGYGEKCIYMHTRIPKNIIDKNKRQNICMVCKQTSEDKFRSNCTHVICLKCLLEKTELSRKCYICGSYLYGRFFPT